MSLWPNLSRTHSLDKSSPDFWSLGVQSDGQWPVVKGARPEALGRRAHILDGLSMVLYDVECYKKNAFSKKEIYES